MSSVWRQLLLNGFHTALLTVTLLSSRISQAEELDIRKLQGVLRHIPKAGDIVQLDLSVDGNGRLTAAAAKLSGRRRWRWRTRNPGLLALGRYLRDKYSPA